MAVRDHTPLTVVSGPAASTGPVTMRGHGPAPMSPTLRGAVIGTNCTPLRPPRPPLLGISLRSIRFTTMTDMKPRSHEVTDGMERAPARAMLRAVGMTDADWGKAQVGVASSWNEVTPCNMPLDRLAKRAKDGVRDAGGFPIEFVTIAVSDGISMGHEGMRALARLARDHRRLGRVRDARRAVRRAASRSPAATRACPAC